MKRSLIIAVVIVSLASIALAKPIPAEKTDLPRLAEESALPVLAPGPQAKSVDTTWVYGGPDTWEGRFETPEGQADWQGWTHEDISLPAENNWHVSNHLGELLGDPGNHAMYCGNESIPACDSLDTVGGYGDLWLNDLAWSGVVPDPSQPVTVRIVGLIDYDLEDIYDNLYLFADRNGVHQSIDYWTGTAGPSESFDITMTFQPEEYSGPGADTVRLFWRVKTDGGWSDTDCMWPSRGAARLDNIAVSFDGVLQTFDDFEPGNPVNWQPETPVLGDFANLRNDLDDIDPCGDNHSWQVNFIDDGVVVPGTGGTPCINHCYGPDGWIVNNTGGLLDPNYHLLNRVLSPPIPWPAGLDGAELLFDVYRHDDLNTGSAGMLHFWNIRSTADPDPAALEDAPWLDSFFVYYGQGYYSREEISVEQHLVQDRSWVQVALGLYEYGWVLGRDETDGTPAPYFDNVGLRAWDPQGPKLHLESESRFGDAFPEQGFLDPDDLGSNWCRIDGVVPYPTGAPRDSLLVGIRTMRQGGTLSPPATIHWVLKCNPVFDAVRPAAPDGSGVLRGSATGFATGNSYTYPDTFRHWAFDLPDTGYFFPGDRLRWYVIASEDVGGDVRTSVFPPDTTGILDFGPESGYRAAAEISGLPTVGEPDGGSFPHPSLVFMDRTRGLNDTSSWTEALREIGLVRGADFDVVRPETFFFKSSPTLAYETLVITYGTEYRNIHTDFYIMGPQLESGGMRLLLAGDRFGSGINLEDRLGFDVDHYNIREINGGAYDLQITTQPFGGVFPYGMEWQVPYDCPGWHPTDALIPAGDGFALATLDPAGSGSNGPHAAAIAHEDPVLDNRTVVVPIDLSRIDALSGGSSPLSPRAAFLAPLLDWLQTGEVSPVDDVPGVREVAVTAHPNPFNPATTISFALPRAGAVTLEIFDIQGRKVRTLLDDQHFEAGRHEQPWDGRDAGGRGVSSGVYFYRFAAGAEERVGKLTLLK